MLQLDHGLAISLDILGTLLDPADGQDLETRQIKAFGSESEKVSSCSLNQQSVTVVTDSSESREESVYHFSLQRPGLNN